MKAVVLAHPSAPPAQELPEAWQKLQAIDALEALRVRWGTDLVRHWLVSLDALAAKRAGEAS